jgi:hypothetical protein
MISSYQEIIYGLSPGKAEGFYRRKRDVSRKTTAKRLQVRAVQVRAVDSLLLF